MVRRPPLFSTVMLPSRYSGSSIVVVGESDTCWTILHCDKEALEVDVERHWLGALCENAAQIGIRVNRVGDGLAPWLYLNV